MTSRNLANYYKWGIRIGVWILPILTIYISKSLYFPYVTGKMFIFRLLVELMLVLWVGLMVLDKRYRPSWSAINIAIIGLLVVVGLADLLGVNPSLSFWSRFERMDGYLNLLHMTGLFFVLSTVFKERWEWLWLWKSFVWVSLFHIGRAVLQKLGYVEAIIGGTRVDGYFGNPTYLAAFLMFSSVLGLILFLETKEKNWRYIYGGIIFLNLVGIYLTATRGVILAMGVGVVVFSLVYLIKTKRIEGEPKIIRKILVGLLILAVVTPVALKLGQNTSLVQKNETLRRLAEISLEDRTTQGRFLVWNVAWQGVKERPVLGWGQENFIDVFNKYYDPAMYNQEMWFDRAHNIVLDWLVTAGWLGLIGFLSLFVIAFNYVFKYLRKEGRFRFKIEVLLLGVLLLAYFLQNLLVFDNYGTYIGFWSVLAYIAYLNNKKREEFDLSVSEKNITKSKVYLAGALVVMVGVGWSITYRPVVQAGMIVEAIKLMRQSGSVGEPVLETYKRAGNYGSMGDIEAREQMGKVITEILITSIGDNVPPAEEKAFVMSTLEQIEKSIEIYPNNVRTRLFLGTIYTRYIGYDPSYKEKGLEHLRAALEISPMKQQIYFALAEYYIKINDTEKAWQILEKAVELAPEYDVARGNLGYLAVFMGYHSVADEMLKVVYRPQELIKVGEAYMKIQDFNRAIPFFEKAVEIYSGNINYKARLAGLYLNQGRRDEAIVQAIEILNIDSVTLKKDLELFFKNVGVDIDIDKYESDGEYKKEIDVKYNIGD